MSNVLEFRKGSEGLREELKHIEEMNNKGLITNFIVIYTTEEKDISQIPDNCTPHRFWHYWFGNSSFLCLGLVERMRVIINNWIESAN